MRDDGSTEAFAKPLSDGSVAVGLFNRGDTASAVRATATQVGLSGGPFTLTGLWTGGTSSTAGQISASVPAHGVAVFRVSGGSPPAATTSRLRGEGCGRCADVDHASAAAAPTAGCGKAPALTSGPHTIQSGGTSRNFILRIPDGYDRNRAYRLVFGFHWLGGTSTDVATGRTVETGTWASYGLQRLANNSTDQPASRAGERRPQRHHRSRHVGRHRLPGDPHRQQRSAELLDPQRHGLRHDSDRAEVTDGSSAPDLALSACGWAPGRASRGQEVVPVTVLPDLVTWYVTVAPLQKWKVSSTRVSSLRASRKAGVRPMVFLA